MASSSSNPHVTLEVEEEFPYPYPSHVYTPSFVSLKLSGRDDYSMWKTQMVCLLKSHDMFGFIDGKVVSPQTSSSYSGKEKVGGHNTHWLWSRSDALVKGWIIGSLSRETLSFVLNRLTENLDQQSHADADFSAKDVWDELQRIYGPPVFSQQLFVDKQEDEERADAKVRLLDAILKAELAIFDDPSRKVKLTVIDKITDNGNTALHIAIGTTKESKFLLKLLDRTPENTQLSDLKNSDGSTLLHIAAIVGNTDAADILVARNSDLLFTKDNEGRTPLAIALSNMHTETATHMLEHIDKVEQSVPRPTHLGVSRLIKSSPFLAKTGITHHPQRTPYRQEMKYMVQVGGESKLFCGKSGDELLVSVISSKDFNLACGLVTRYKTLHSDAVLMAIAQNFPSQLNTFEKYIASNNKRILPSWGSLCAGVRWKRNDEMIDRLLRRVKGVSRTASDHTVQRCVPLCGSKVETTIKLFYHGIYPIVKFFSLIISMLVSPFIKGRMERHNKALELLLVVCDLIRRSVDPNSHHHYYMNPICEATRQNAKEIVKKITSFFPNAIWSANEDGHNMIQYAVINRSENVYNILYEMSEHRNIYRTMKDNSGNNLLHLAARIAPTKRLNLISGAALQIQRELQWFKEVEGFVCPINITQKNSFDETPQMVFTREHKDLVIEGEKWIKTTAESYTITAALITTIMFAAAITVPGGNHQDTGMPIFTNNTAFIVFAISDAISLFAAVTSLLTFLSILTTRFSEWDFLFKLPTQLIIGLATLFISTTAMIVAFGATLYIVFGQNSSSILIPIAVLTCLPITCFVTLQFSLVLDLMSTTYGPTIFVKKRNRAFY